MNDNPKEPHSPNGSPAGPDSTPPGLDEQALGRLRELDPDGVNGVLARVLKTYEGSLVSSLAEVERSRLAQDWESLGRLTHTLKSSSASVGALQLSKRCATVERLVREQRTDSLDGELDALMAAGNLALLAVRAMLTP